jgi:phenylpropionate dioxygenase-like ring-hydroxylating dioxygenase large terminal subunit
MSDQNPINFKNFWYIACESHELKNDKPLARKILDEWIVIFRDENSNPRAFQDRCIHRNSQLSKGWVKDGKLQCSYHGWVFKGDGKVINIPSQGPEQINIINRCAKVYEAIEQDDFIYIRLEENKSLQTAPYKMPAYKKKGFETIRLFNKFENSVLNCAENYIDVPHTVFVHDKIFRVALNEEITAKVTRVDGKVIIDYIGESDNLGWFSRFINPKKLPITHIDTYFMPNFTSVQYIVNKVEYWISSQSIPVSKNETWVWTDLTYNFGSKFINKALKPIMRYQGQSVIDQDITVLNNQGKVIEKYGANFSNATADLIHVYIESIYNAIEKGSDPRQLSKIQKDLKFWI